MADSQARARKYTTSVDHFTESEPKKQLTKWWRSSWAATRTSTEKILGNLSIRLNRDNKGSHPLNKLGIHEAKHKQESGAEGKCFLIRKATWKT